MKANVAFVSLQSVEKYDLFESSLKYFVSNGWQVPVPSPSHSPTKVLHAATKSTSKTAIEVKKRGPSKKIGRMVTAEYAGQTQATATAAVAFVGMFTSAFEKSLIMAATKPMTGIEITA